MSETSPPAWGKPCESRRRMPRRRNIPTCVGKTMFLFRFLMLHLKHPHLRGENARAGVEHRTIWETSPPAWGKLLVVGIIGFAPGNIPTCVGKTTTSMTVAALTWKHPHLRGENTRNAPFLAPAVETSPPAWGKPRRGLGEIQELGNIPTCVGKTNGTLRCRRRPRKHPHLRGENVDVESTAERIPETSPPAWGKQQDVVLTAILDTTFC